MPPGDRTTREPHARSFGECSLVRFHSSRDSALEFRRNGSDLHSTDRGGGASRCPVERRVKRRKLQDCESPQLLLGISEGAILYTPLSILQPNRCSGLRGLKGIATDVDVGLDERFVVRPPRTE